MNMTWDGVEEKYKALYTVPMAKRMRAINTGGMQKLASRLNSAGYEARYDPKHGVEIEYIDQALKDKHSSRAVTKHARLKLFKEKYGVAESSAGLRKFMERTRAKKQHMTKDKFLEAQLAKMTEEECNRLRSNAEKAIASASRDLEVDQVKEVVMSEDVVKTAVAADQSIREETSHVQSARESVELGLSHVFSRVSVAKPEEVLNEAAKLSKCTDVPAMEEELYRHPDVILRTSQHGEELTLKSIVREELSSIDVALRGRNAFFPMLRSEDISLPDKLAADQRQVVNEVLSSKDRVSVIIGIAGTGKSTVARCIEELFEEKHGQGFVALAPTAKARFGLKETGFKETMTLQSFLSREETTRTPSRDRVVLLDEAGLASTTQIEMLSQLAEQNNLRLILIGDDKQHLSIERGAGLRNLYSGAGITPSRLYEIKRQGSEEHKAISKSLAAYKAQDAIVDMTNAGMIKERNEEAIYGAAVDRYVQKLKANVDCIVVCPVWAEIDEFHSTLRDRLRAEKLLGAVETTRTVTHSAYFTDAQKRSFHLYKPGEHLLTFHRQTKDFKANETVEVREIKPDRLVVRKDDGSKAIVTKKQIKAFDVGEKKELSIAVGDKLLLRANYHPLGRNGDVLKVTEVKDNQVIVDGYKRLPKSFKSIAHGHAITSQRAQGLGADESLVLMGRTSTFRANKRQLYVSNTRYKRDNLLMTFDLRRLTKALSSNKENRELGREFLQRIGEFSIEKYRKDGNKEFLGELAAPLSYEAKKKHNVSVLKHKVLGLLRKAGPGIGAGRSAA